MQTGIYFHPLFGQKEWPIIGNKYKDFPQLLEDLLRLPQVRLFEPQEAPSQLLSKVHTLQFLADVQEEWYYQGAALSAGGSVEACEKVFEGELQNAFVFSVAAGHHAGPSYAWGGTYLSCSGPAVYNLREKHGRKKVAIIDTDAHHGDGTRAIFGGDPLTLHTCFCYETLTEEDGLKTCVNTSGQLSDEDYLEKIRSHFSPLVEKFEPELIIHLMGHDSCKGDYEDRGLNPSFFSRAVEELKALAEKFCDGKLVIISIGGAKTEVTNTIIPQVINTLVQRNEKET